MERERERERERLVLKVLLFIGISFLHPEFPNQFQLTILFSFAYTYLFSFFSIPLSFKYDSYYYIFILCLFHLIPVNSKAAWVRHCFTALTISLSVPTNPLLCKKCLMIRHSDIPTCMLSEVDSWANCDQGRMTINCFNVGLTYSIFKGLLIGDHLTVLKR